MLAPCSCPAPEGRLDRRTGPLLYYRECRSEALEKKGGYGGLGGLCHARTLV